MKRLSLILLICFSNIPQIDNSSQMIVINKEQEIELSLDEEYQSVKIILNNNDYLFNQSETISLTKDLFIPSNYFKVFLDNEFLAIVHYKSIEEAIDLSKIQNLRLDYYFFSYQIEIINDDKNNFYFEDLSFGIKIYLENLFCLKSIYLLVDLEDKYFSYPYSNAYHGYVLKMNIDEDNLLMISNTLKVPINFEKEYYDITYYFLVNDSYLFLKKRLYIDIDLKKLSLIENSVSNYEGEIII